MYPHFVYLYTIINIALYSTPGIGSLNFSNFTIKSYNMTSYSLVGISTSYSPPYSLYLTSLFL